MRICHVITKPELGGAQLSTLNLISNLPENKYQVSVITSPSGILKHEFKGLKNTTVYFSRFLTRPVNPIFDILALMHIFNIYRSNRFGIIHTHSSKAGIIGRWSAVLYNLMICRRKVKGARCRIVHTVHGWPFNNYQNIIKKWFFILLERMAAAFTDKIICVSKRDTETGLRYKIAPEEKFVLIRYGIPLYRFKNSNCNKACKRKELGINNDDPVVGMISCLKPQKSPLDYVKSCIDIYSRRRDVNFLLIGDGVLKKRCESEISKSRLDGRFIFTGWRRDVSEVLDILDVVVLTSKWEGMSVAIIEALSKGKPAVITDAGGARELVNDGISGYITKPGAYRETAEKVLAVLNDKERFIKMSKEAELSIGESFDIKNMTKQIERVYQGGA